MTRSETVEGSPGVLELDQRSAVALGGVCAVLKAPPDWAASGRGDSDSM
jgi:hypothetical protein